MTHLKLTCLDCGQVNRVPAERAFSRPICAVCATALISAKPTEIDLRTLEKAARNDDLPLVVDFWAAWCGPCRAMAPEFAKAAQELFGQARLVKLNTEAEPQGGARYGIRSIPTMVKFTAGREAKRQSGAVSASAIIGWAKT